MGFIFFENVTYRGKKRKKKDPTDWPEVANKEREIITAPTGHNELFYLELKWVHVICPLTFDLYNRTNQTVTDTESTFYTKYPFSSREYVQYYSRVK